MKKHKVLLIGCGGMSHTWLKYILRRKDCEILGLCDIIPEKARQMREDYNLDCAVFDEIKKALGANLGFDLAIDCTSPEAHEYVVTSALRAGCDVFGEKPMADTLDRAEKMVACAEEMNKTYCIMQNRRYYPYIVAFKNFVQSQKLGDAGQVSANFQTNPYFGGFREEMDSPLLSDMGIHTFDAARFITGKNAVAVCCKEFNPSWTRYKGDAAAVCIFEMEDGSIFDYRGSWCANGINTSWESEWRISCAGGAVFWDGNDKLFYDETTADTSEMKFENIQPVNLPITGDFSDHFMCVEEMFESLNAGTRAQTDCRDNIHSIRMVYRAIESSKTRKFVIL